MKRYSNLLLAVFFIFTSCASIEGIGGKALDVPPEFNQPVFLEVGDSYQQFQAALSGYDIGDLQNFHSQHSLPILVEDAFKQMFGEVKMREPGEPSLNFGASEIPATFEVRLLDLANDIYIEGADDYRAEATLAVAMKSPKGTVMWQKAFRASGYTIVDPQYSLGIGPQDAVLDAVHDAIDQMQQAIVDAPEVRAHLKHYRDLQAKLKLGSQSPGQLQLTPDSSE